MNCTVSWSLLATVYWLIEGMETDDQSFFAGDMPIRLLSPSFNKGKTSPRKRYSCRNRCWYYKIDGTCCVNLEIQENRNGRK